MKTHSAVFVPPSRLIVGHVDCVAAGLGGWGSVNEVVKESHWDPSTSLEHTNSYTLNSLKQLSAGESGAKRNSADWKMSCFSHMEAKVEGPFRVFVCLSVCKCKYVSAKREFVCAYSLFGGGFLSALKVQRVWDTRRECVWFCPPSLPEASLKETGSVCVCVCVCKSSHRPSLAPEACLAEQYYRCSLPNSGCSWKKIYSQAGKLAWLDEWEK